MKKILFITFAFIYSVSFSQNEIESLTSDFKNYIKANNESDFENLLNYYPDFAFDSISKKEIIKEFKKFFSKKSKNKVLMDLEFSIDTIISKNKKYYTRINHGQNITMDFTEFKNENGMDYAVTMAYGAFVEEYGKENVTYKKGEWIFNIRSNKPVYGIKSDKDNWKFIELNEDTEKYIPIEVQ